MLAHRFPIDCGCVVRVCVCARIRTWLAYLKALGNNGRVALYRRIQLTHPMEVLHTHTHTHMHAHICTRTHTRTYTSTHPRTRAHTYTRTHARTHTHTHTRVHSVQLFTLTEVSAQRQHLFCRTQPSRAHTLTLIHTHTHSHTHPLCVSFTHIHTPGRCRWHPSRSRSRPAHQRSTQGCSPTPSPSVCGCRHAQTDRQTARQTY